MRKYKEFNMNEEEKSKLKKSVDDLKAEIDKFINNDFKHFLKRFSALSKKVDSLSVKIALILLGYFALNTVALFIIVKFG